MNVTCLVCERDLSHFLNVLLYDTKEHIKGRKYAGKSVVHFLTWLCRAKFVLQRKMFCIYPIPIFAFEKKML